MRLFILECALRPGWGIAGLLLAGGLVGAAEPAPALPPAPQPSKVRNLHLEEYVLKSGPVALEGVRNASGLAWNPDTKTVFLVMNKPKRVIELAPEGARKREIMLKGFSDTEAIAYLGAGVFAVAEEKRRTLALFTIPAGATEVQYPAKSVACIDLEPAGNSALEGVAYDPATRQLYAVKEKDPRRVYKVSRDRVEKGESDCSHPWDAEKDELGLKDQSDLCFHTGTGHLLLLSHESLCLVECTVEGREVSRLKLTAGSAGLKDDIPQAEGVAADGEGNLYICSEPNLFYIFAKQEAKAGQ